MLLLLLLCRYCHYLYYYRYLQLALLLITSSTTIQESGYCAFQPNTQEVTDCSRIAVKGGTQRATDTSDAVRLS